MTWSLCVLSDKLGVFDDLQYSITNLELASPESLCQLDTEVFLYCVVSYCALPAPSCAPIPPLRLPSPSLPSPSLKLASPESLCQLDTEVFLYCVVSY